MKQCALGLIETRGLVAAIEAADTALKTAAVELMACEKVKGGLVTVVLTGEVAAVQAAVEAGSAAAAGLGMLISRHVIPRPMADMELLVIRRKLSPVEPIGEITGIDSVELSEGMQAQKKYLESLSVEELRRLARETEGMAIKGRAISRANKGQLITEILRAGRSEQ